MQSQPFVTKPPHITVQQRVQLALSCTDCDAVPKHALAGQKQTDANGNQWQVMHNGLLVEYGGYYGEWMAGIICGLSGHHEPQEELAFHLAMQRLRDKPNMIELGGFWAYYSLWFKHVYPSGCAHVIEPNETHLEVGRRNFQRNGMTAHFERAAGGLDANVEFYCETSGALRAINSKSVDRICAEQNIDFLDILHIDIQGAELNALMGAKKIIERKKIRFVFVSTHHHSISGDPLTHQKCIHWLQETGAHIICEHTVHESFSGDGLIFASYAVEDCDWAVELSRARASHSLFRELEYDLAEMKPVAC